MKYVLTLLFTASAIGHAQGFVAKPAAKDGVTACEKKVEAFIHKVAVEMGGPKKFAVHLTSETAGTDVNDKPLTAYKSGVFIIDEGYLSNSSASATVRDADKTCEIVKLYVSVGG